MEFRGELVCFSLARATLQPRSLEAQGLSTVGARHAPAVEVCLRRRARDPILGPEILPAACGLLPFAPEWQVVRLASLRK